MSATCSSNTPLGLARVGPGERGDAAQPVADRVRVQVQRARAVVGRRAAGAQPGPQRVHQLAATGAVVLLQRAESAVGEAAQPVRRPRLQQHPGHAEPVEVDTAGAVLAGQPVRRPDRAPGHRVVGDLGHRAARARSDSRLPACAESAVGERVAPGRGAGHQHDERTVVFSGERSRTEPRGQPVDQRRRARRPGPETCRPGRGRGPARRCAAGSGRGRARGPGRAGCARRRCRSPARRPGRGSAAARSPRRGGA